MSNGEAGSQQPPDRSGDVRLWVAFVCGVVALASVLGIVTLAALGAEPPPTLGAVAGAALGILSGLVPGYVARARGRD